MSIPGITREAEEQFLTDTIAVAQNNLDHILEEIRTLTEDTENFMFEANKTKDHAILTLWNNVRAQLNESKNWMLRAGQARKKPYFGRIDFKELAEKKEESFYIGRVGISRTPTEPVVIDWRAPVASLYYDNGIGKGTYMADKTYEVDLKRKRTYEIEDDQLKDFYDMDVVSNDELLTKYLSKNKTEVLGEIIATIQKEQNQIIRRSPKTNVIVQGVAGSGKTTVAMHRISYILFNYQEDFRPEDFYIISSNQVLLNYITGVLPELDVYGAKQMTMEELFVRLIYEDWDAKKYEFHPLSQSDPGSFRKGTTLWFRDLEAFCADYEKEQIPDDDIYLEHYDKLLLSGERIRTYIAEHPTVSLQSKRLMLNEILFSQYENVMSGRYGKLTEEERKESEKKYSTWFARWGKYGKSDWNGSVFELYHEFLCRQKERIPDLVIPETSFDVYDLAALAYLYKRVKETDPIREASHVVIDEAQDFGMMAYDCLHYCLRGCTYTVMGDTSQNIHDEYGLNDWKELKTLLLTGQKDAFFLLRKSYRNTIEISEFATDILRHGNFPIYPVEPIIRHGKQVQVTNCRSTVELTEQAVDTIRSWQKEGYETISVVCRDDAETKRVLKRLKDRLPVRDMSADEAEFGSGVMVMSVSATKGLEFDAVLIWDPNITKYAPTDGNVRILYVAATRALHRLTILHTRNLTPLIGEKVSGTKRLEEFTSEVPNEKENLTPKLSDRERMEQQKADARRESAERNYLGPERIPARPAREEKTGIQVAKPETASGTGRSVSSRSSQGIRLTERARMIASGGTVNNTEEEGKKNSSPYRFGEIPADAALAVKGHAKPNIAVKWVKKSKASLEITSAYGVLTLTPISESRIHIQFAKPLALPNAAFTPEKPEAGLKWTARESATVIEVATKRVMVRIEKRDGALKFLTPERKPLLAELSSGSRFLDGEETWNFFDFERSEHLKAKGSIKDDFADVTNKCRYISYGGRLLRMPTLISGKGYQLQFAAPETVMFCGLRNYGPYIYTNGTDVIDYYFERN